MDDIIVSIVDSAVAAEPLVISRLVVKMDAMVKSGAPSYVRTDFGPYSQMRLPLRPSRSRMVKNVRSIFVELKMNGYVIRPDLYSARSYCTVSDGSGSHEDLGESARVPRDSGVLSSHISHCIYQPLDIHLRVVVLGFSHLDVYIWICTEPFVGRERNRFGTIFGRIECNV
jgi:hypothetical protein